VNNERRGIPGRQLQCLTFFLWMLFCQITPCSFAQAADPATSATNHWQEAQPGYIFSFPRDHAAHSPYRTEWWYYTGNLETAEGRRLGYQLTFFRTGVTPTPTTLSQWALRDLYMAHFAIADLDNQQFVFFERLNRAGVHWAGADTAQYRVWNEGWEVQLEGDTHVLSASDGTATLALRLTPEKPPILHGNSGFSQKGASAGNASHYYSLTRLRTSGTLHVDGKTHSVTGLSWMDHEFGTSFLERDQVGWDWFSLQLQDGRELMLFQIRRADGSIDLHSSGTMVETNGSTAHLSVSEFSLVPEQYWQSPESGARYPIVWTLTLPSQELQLHVSAALPNQELRTEASTGVTYWEGSVIVSGKSGDRDVHGRGYLEMTGYTGKSMGPMLGGQ
jgi:predicted secreted hydrolase